MHYGNETIPKDSALEPKVGIAGDDSSTYSILMVDADPLRPFGPALYWAAGISKSSTLPHGGPADALIFYAGPAPPPFSGIHRYIFLVHRNLTPEGLLPLKKQAKIKGDDIRMRMRFDMARFAKENGLELVGVNWFKSRRV